MNRTSSILILAMVAGTAWAQMPANAINKAKGAAAQMNEKTAQTNAALPTSSAQKSPTPAKSAPATTSKPAAATAVKPATATAKPATTAAKPAPAVSKPASTPVKATKPAAQKTVAPVASKAAAPAPAATAPAAASPAPEISNAKKRDPFLSPIVAKSGGPSNCSGGKKCLVVDQVILRGIVRSQGGMIAVVVNAANKAYFMRENDPVYNGFVVKITPDSVVFRETVTDRLGKPGTREVVKKVNAPVV